MKNLFLILILSFFLNTCTSTLNKEYVEYNEKITNALNLEIDRYEGNFGNNLQNKFQIKKTLSDGNKICRIVSLDYESSGRKKRKIETYCKIKGGSWK